MTILDSRNIKEFVLVISKRYVGEALHRLQAQPLLQGMDCRGSSVRTMVLENPTPAHFSPESALIFVYEDVAAADTIRAAVAQARVGIVVCLCSDIYNLDEYVALHDLVDIYVAPTPYHQRILSAQLYKPVYLLPECVDPISSQTTKYDRHAPIYDYSRRDARGTRICWFGHAESFNKSMASIIPVIVANVDRGSIQAFETILNKGLFNNLYGVSASNYGNDTFWRDSQSFGYCLLSHIALDLSINTFIKSPNKLITALFCGLVPLVSDTPNYRDLMQRFGLTKFIYTGPRDLDAILRNLDPVRDWEYVRNSGVLEALSDELSIEKTASRFVDILDHWCQNAQHLRHGEFTLQSFKPPQPPFRYYARELLPSAFRAIKRRVRGRVQI